MNAMIIAATLLSKFQYHSNGTIYRYPHKEEFEETLKVLMQELLTHREVDEDGDA